MTNAKEIPFDQIRSWVRAESAKGRLMKEIVAELATRNNVTVLSAIAPRLDIKRLLTQCFSARIPRPCTQCRGGIAGRTKERSPPIILDT